MPDLQWNSQTWDGEYKWPKHGEEWSEFWGGAEAQWFSTIYPRIHRFLPANAVLEIASGHGRWTKYLLPRCKRYVGVDLAQSAIDHCKEVYPQGRFFKNDGLSLQAAEGEFDFVFSFDALVHVKMDVLAGYITQTLQKLRPDGAAFFHHSNALEFAEEIIHKPDHNIGFRGRSVSGEKVCKIIEARQGRVLVQEKVNWGGDTKLVDCFTLFARGPFTEPLVLRNFQFHTEATLVKEFHSPYSPDDRSWHLSPEGR
jgi:SAM-dependent methyltransferase